MIGMDRVYKFTYTSCNHIEWILPFSEIPEWLKTKHKIKTKYFCLYVLTITKVFFFKIIETYNIHLCINSINKTKE